nr:MAG TPA: hypothetical protein [Caudoviricetes sp.]
MPFQFEKQRHKRKRGGCFFAVIIYTIQGRFSNCIFWQFSRLQLYTLCGNM